MKAAGEYCAGQISFAEFVHRNEKDWRRMARHLLRKFPLESMAEDDVVQELLIGSWQALHKYDPARAGSMTADSFVVFRGISHVKKQMRKVLRPRDELLSDEVEDPRVEPGEQLDAMARKQQLYALIQQCTKLTDAVCLIAFYREQDCSNATLSLYNDAETRRLCRFGSLPEAARKMRRVLDKHSQLQGTNANS